jgi:hypothetical protein
MQKAHLSLAFILFLLVTTSTPPLAAPLKPRLIVLTDIGPNDVEPDDRESMIRLLAHADLFEIEGLIATTGWNTGDYPASWMDSIKVSINAYEKDLPNLQKRSKQTGFLTDESKQETGYWPSADYLRSRTMLGSKKMGYGALGDNNNSAGSDQIIKMADENDERPLWVSVWGGGNTLAQAIWRVQKERTADQLKTFLHKIRVYTITDQDKPYGSTVAFSISSHQWMRREFAGDLMFIWDECAWLYQNSTGVNRWTDYATNIQGHGNLGAQYPKYRWGVEGDTPSYMYLLAPGLSNPDITTQGSWGGYFEWMKSPDSVTYAYTNYQGTSAYTICLKQVTSFYQADFNNFAARMDWAKDGTGNRNPVVVVNSDSGISILTIKPLQGTSVTLDASSSYDPDGSTMTFKWWTIPEAGTYTPAITIANATSNRITVNVPSNSAGKSFHVVCEVTDNGTPNLTGYRRIIFEPTDQASIVKAPVQKRSPVNKINLKAIAYDLTGRELTAVQHTHRTPRGLILYKDHQNRVIPILLSR